MMAAGLAGFVISSVLCGTGLAMDAFSVSMVHGLKEPHMRRRKEGVIAGTFAVFQFLMPLAGWFFVHTAAERFEAFQKWIPWIAFVLLLYIGGKMLLEGIREYREQKKNGPEAPDALPAEYVKLGAHRRKWMTELMMQGIATSIDALSVGFLIAGYGFRAALSESLIIGAVTLVICLAGIRIGRIAGLKLSSFASLLGGIILIGIGIRILL